MKLSFRYLSFISFVALLSNFNSPVLAQENWPNRPITMVIPFPPGGVADTVGRPVADALSRSLGQPVIVENRPGAGGGIPEGLSSTGRMVGVAAGQIAPGGRPDVQSLLASLTQRGEPNLQASLVRRLPVA